MLEGNYFKKRENKAFRCFCVTLYQTNKQVESEK